MAGTSPTYDALLEVLARYMSRIMARGVLDRAVARAHVAPEHLTAKHVSVVVEHARVGVGMFCEPERLAQLMLELADVCHAHGASQAHMPAVRPKTDGGRGAA